MRVLVIPASKHGGTAEIGRFQAHIIGSAWDEIEKWVESIVKILQH